MDLTLNYARKRREMETGLTLLGTRRGSLSGERPNLSELRIVLLGKDAQANSRVKHFLLRMDKSEAPPADVDQLTKSRIQLEDRHITVINTPHLLQSNLSYHQITKGVRECVYLSDPGPHLIILVLQHNYFDEDEIEKVIYVLELFSENAIKHTMVLNTDTETPSSPLASDIKTDAIHQLIKKCGGGHLQFDETKPECHSDIIQRVEKIKKEYGEFLRCEIFDDAEEGTSLDTEQSTPREFARQEEKKEEDTTCKEAEKPKECYKKGYDGGVLSNLLTGKAELNLVLCGSNNKLKASVSRILRGKTSSVPHKESCLVSVKKEEKKHGQHITVVELPALTKLSEEEVIYQTLRCVSLCDSKVHHFLLIIPVGPLTDEDKAEMEMIQKIFYSREHFMVLFTTDFTVDQRVTNFVQSAESQRVAHLYGSWNSLLGLKDQRSSKQISDLLKCIERMNLEPYSCLMYIKAQEKIARHELEGQISKMDSKIKDLQQKIHQQGDEDAPSDSSSLRIVLIGKTGNGKSETGNTILAKKEFHTKASSDSVTTVCMKGVGKVQGRSVAVVDTPGLFDTTLSNEQVQEEIVKCISLSAPGPHVFIIVISVGRFTKEEKDTVSLIKGIFGLKAAQFSIVLFTRGDDLEDETIEQYVEKSKNAELKKLITDCGNRFLVFNNKKKEDHTQVTRLFNMIEEMKKYTHGQYFTNDMFEEAEMSIKKRVEEILKDKEREIQAKYVMEMENMKDKQEEEKRKADEERMKMENQLKEKVETLRKEFEEREKTEQKRQEEEDKKRSDEEKQQKVEYHKKIEKMQRETENQRSLYEKQQKEKEEEHKKREEEYKQDQEKLKDEQKCVIAELKREQDEETKRRRLEEQRRIKEEEEERQRWERKIKEHDNDKKEIQENLKQQQREWEEDRKRQTREREEQDRKRKERHEEQLREKQEELEKMRKKSEKEREEERQRIEEERQRWRDSERRVREQKEKELEEKKNELQKYYEQMTQRNQDWEKIKQQEEETRQKEKKSWKKMMDDLKREQEEEISRRKDKEEKERDKMKEEYEQKIQNIKKEHEDEARKQAEKFNEFCSNKDGHIKELSENLKKLLKEYEDLAQLFKHFQEQASVQEEKGFWGKCAIL